MREEPLTVWVSLPGDTSKTGGGTLTFIDNAVDTATGTILLKATFPNEEHTLWPGQFVNVGLVMGTLTGAVTVPSSAVQLSQKGTYLYVIMPGDTADIRSVVTGAVFDETTVIERGVRAGDIVVVDGMSRLRQGSKVTIKQALLSPADAKEPPAP